MTGEALAALSACELARALASGEVSAERVMAAVLAAIEEREPTLKAWVYVDREGALRAARGADARRRAGLPLGPLHGVPFGVKDIFDVAGWETIAGFEPYRGRRAEADSFCVARLRAAGAIPVGKTVTTQFALADPGPTRNPWHPERTPGGSSSGSAAAVGAGTLPLALGSQTAGSVLRPAAYCGVAGFKPTWGRISLDGVLPLAWSLDTPGVLARTAADCERAFRVLDDAERVPAAPLGPPRLLLLHEFLDRSQPDVRDAVLAVAQRLREGGALIDEGELPAPLDTVLAVHQVIMGAEAGAVHADSIVAHRDHYGPRLRAYAEAGALIPAEIYLKADRLRGRLLVEVNARLALGGYDAYLLPTASNAAPTPETTGDRTFQAPWTLLGMPAISLPAGFNAEGLPLAAQLVGARGADYELLALARWVEAALTG